MAAQNNNLDFVLEALNKQSNRLKDTTVFTKFNINLIPLCLLDISSQSSNPIIKVLNFDDEEKEETGSNTETSIYTAEQIIEVNQEIIKISEWLGHVYTQYILDLHNAPYMSAPSNLVTQPHPWQLHGFSKLLYLKQSQFRGGLLADPPGLDKTLTTLLMLNHERSFSKNNLPFIVVCPLGCVRQWQSEVKNNFLEVLTLSILIKCMLTI